MATTDWKLGLIVLAVATTARLVAAQVCDFQRCLDLMKRPVTCGSSREFTKCALRGALQNPACDESIRDQAQMLMLSAEEFQEEHCQRRNAFPVCQHQTCADMLTAQHRTCGSVQEGMRCAQMQVLQNPDCPASAKTQTRALVQQGQQYLAQNCPERPPSPAAFQVQPQAAPSPVANPPPQLPVPDLGLPMVQPGMCDYLKCVDLLTTQQVTCSTLRQARQCFEIHVIGSAACPPPVKNDIRNQLQQEEHYLGCSSQVPIAISTPAITTTSPTLPAPARPPPRARARECVYQECFYLIEQFDLTCSIASGIIDCSRLLSQDPSCPADVKNEALNYILVGQEFLRDQCEEMFPFARK
ncbi:hypothetical protein BsWGS_14445 [Bradybaena similaris]